MERVMRMVSINWNVLRAKNSNIYTLISQSRLAISRVVIVIQEQARGASH